MYSNTPLDLVDTCDGEKSLSSVSFQKSHRAERNVCIEKRKRKRKQWKKRTRVGRVILLWACYYCLKIYFVLWSDRSVCPVISWPSWNNLLRITGAKLNMSLGRASDVWNRADFPRFSWTLASPPSGRTGVCGWDRLTDGFFQEGGVSQACQSCLMSSLSYPQVASWVQTSAAEWAPALVRVVCVHHTCVFAVSIDRRSHSVWFKASFSRLVPPRIFTQRPL